MGKRSLLERLGLRPPPLSYEAFLIAAEDRVRSRLPEVRTSLDERGVLEAWIGDDGPWTVNLSRAYATYLEDPRRIDEILDRHTVVLGRPAAVATPEQLVVLVRPSSFDPVHSPQADGSGLFRPVAGDLMGIVAINGPDAYFFQSAVGLCAELQMGEDDVWARAVANTRPLLPPSLPVPKPKTLDALSVASGCAASALIFDDLWDDLAARMRGAVLVAPVERNVVLISRDEPEGRAAALGTSRRIAAEASGYLSTLLLRRHSGRWEVLP